MLNSVNDTHRTYIQTTLLGMLVPLAFGLTACQSTSSVVQTKPAKPIMTIPSSSPPSQLPNSTDRVIFIDAPPPLVPTTPTTVIIDSPNRTSSQDKTDILTAPHRDTNTNPSAHMPDVFSDVSQSSPSDPVPNSTQGNVIQDTSIKESPAKNSVTTGNVTIDSAPRASASQPTSHNTTPTNNNVPVHIPVVKIPEPDRRTPQEILLERARSHSQANEHTPAPVLENGDNVPAFRRLMQTGIRQLQNGDYTNADSTFTRAQRLAPQSASVYYYLGQVALKRNQPKRAEAMARRGLVVAQTLTQRKQLWQVILISGEAQQRPRVISEAQAALASLSY